MIFKVPAAASGLSGFEVTDKVRFVYDVSTGEYGFQEKMLNKTGGASVKGYLLFPSSGTDLGVDHGGTDDPDPIAVCYEAGVADASEMWCWTHGLVEVYAAAAVTRGYIIRSVATGDSDTTAGRMTPEAMPTPPFATDNHFQEVAHAAKASGGAGLVLAWFLHAN